MVRSLGCSLAQLESPNVIAHVDPGHQLTLAQVVQVSERRGRVPMKMRDPLMHFPVRHGDFCQFQFVQHRQSLLGAFESRFAQGLSPLGAGRGVGDGNARHGSNPTAGCCCKSYLIAS